MSKKPENIDTYQDLKARDIEKQIEERDRREAIQMYKDGRGAPITESSAHYMNEHGDTFTGEQIAAVLGEFVPGFELWRWTIKEDGTYWFNAARLILQARARIAELEANPYYDGTKGAQSGKWDGSALRCAAEFWEKECIQARAERDEWQRKWASATSAAEALAIVERDAALTARDEWKLKFHLSIDDALAARKERDAAQERMREFAAQKAHFMAERDDALARVREVEDCHERTKELCDVHCERIAALEAENAELRKNFRLACVAISNPDRIAENERLRVAWGKVETMFNWAQFRATDPAMHIRTYLRAALKGEGDE